MIPQLTGKIPIDVINMAAQFGQQRKNQSRKQGNNIRSHSGGISGTWDKDGAIGEFLISHLFDLPEPELNKFKKEPDIGPFEVETVRRDPGDNRPARLIIRPSDLEQDCGTRPYILVILSNDQYHIAGWIMGNEGLNKGVIYEQGGDPCWMVGELHPIDNEMMEFVDWWKNH